MNANTLDQVTSEPPQQADHVSPPSYNEPGYRKIIHWPALLFIVSVHLISIAGFFTFSWQALLLCLALHWASGGLGITLGYHRLLTHRSFKTPKFLEYFFALMGTLACQGDPISWVTAHRVHHLYSDEDKDPHSPKRGFFWAHMGWCMVENKLISEKNPKNRHAPDLVNDPFYKILEKTHIAWTAVLGILLYALGGWPFVVWGVFVRLVLVYHSTWLVNSAAHIWGYRTYKSNDLSTNNWWVALITYGEGWHNNHHAFQYSARHGLRWWEFDSTYLLIRTLELLGLAKAVKIPSAQILQNKEN